MNRAGLAQHEFGDLRVELVASCRDHLIGALHRAEGRGERAPRCVLERIAWLDHRLIADDSVAPDLFDLPGRVADDPVS